MSDTNLIDPSKFPSVELDPGLVSTVAGLLSDLSTRVNGSASAIGSSWSTLPVSYVSTGSEAIYTGMDPVVDAASSLSSGVSSVSAALDEWVSDVLPIKIAFDALADQAATFRYQALHFQGTWELQGSNLWADSWDQDQKMVDKNNALLGKSYVLADRLRVANETLANAIRAAAGLKTEKVTPAVKSAPDGVQTAWGSATGVQESCAGKVIGFPKDVTLGFLGGAGNMLSGLGQLLTGYDFKSWPPPSIAVTQLLLSGDDRGAQATMNAYLGGWGQAWVGMGHLVTGLAMGVTGPLMTEVIMPGQIDQLKKAGADTSVLEGMQQWERDSYTSYVDLFGSFVGYHAPAEWWKATPEEWGAGWSDWADNPGQTLGSSAFNIASVIVPVPGVGEISAALKGGAAGAEDALRVAGDASSAAAHAADAAAGAGRVDLDAARLATGEIDPAARLGALTDDLARAGAAGDHLAGTVHDTGLGSLGSDLSTRLDHLDRIHSEAPPAPSHPTGGDPTASAGASATAARSGVDNLGSSIHDAGRVDDTRPTVGGAAHDRGPSDPASPSNLVDSSIGAHDPGVGAHPEGADHQGSTGLSDAGQSAPADIPSAAHDGGSVPDGPAPGLGRTTGDTPPIYVRPDGEIYHPLTAREHFQHFPDAQGDIARLASEYGLTMHDVFDLAHHTPVPGMDPALAQALLHIRENIPAVRPGEIMQKVLTAQTLDRLLNNGVGSDTLSGFVARAVDAKALVTPDDPAHGLGLDYHGSEFFDAAGRPVDEMYVVRYLQPDHAVLSDPIGDLAGRTGVGVGYRPPGMDPLGPGNPFHGDGFVGTGDKATIPEYYLDRVNGQYQQVFDDGGEIWRIDGNGVEHLAAARIDGLWVRF